MARNRRRGLARRQSDQRVFQVAATRAFQGPLPPPDVIAQYEQLIPGAADRIITQWESQTAHRQTLESRVVNGNVRSQTRGQYFALVISLAILGVAVWLFKHGNDGWAFATIVGELGTVLTAFIVGRAFQRGERASKGEALAQPPSAAFE